MHHGDHLTLNKENGRILRQGNLNQEVEIVRYVTKKSFDAYVWQTLETKQKFISQLFAGSKEIRSMSDIDNTTMNFGEIKAIATDNQEIMEKFEVDMKVQQLKLKERNYKNQRFSYEDKLKIHLPQQIEKESKLVENCKKDLEIRDSNDSDFLIEINSKKFNDPKEAGQEIIKSINRNIDKDILYEIGKYKGFILYIENKFNDEKLYLCKNGVYSVQLSKVPSLNIQRLDEELSKFEKYVENGEKKIKDYQREIEQCKIELQKPFEEENELKELLKRQSELNNKLNLDNNKDKQLLIEDEITDEEEYDFLQEDEEMEE